MSVNYLGTKTNHILGAREINEAQNYLPGASTSNTNQRRITYLLNPAQGQFYSSIVQTDDGNTASYNGLLVSMEHRFANHFTWLANYTWSHCISTYDFGGELAGNNYQNPENRLGEKGDCNFDRRNIFNTSLVAISPGFGGGIAKKLTGDWQVAPIISAYNGQPFSPTTGSDVSLTGVNADRPNIVGPVYTSGISAAGNPMYLSPAGFKAATTGTFGNAGRDSLVGPGSINWDMALSREFRFNESKRLEVRADFFNILNHANWNAPGGGITSGTFGQITSYSSPRLIQLAAKLFF